MSTYRPNDVRFRQRPIMGLDVPRVDLDPTPLSKRNTGALDAMMPGAFVPFSFSAIPVPAGLNIAAGSVAWYGLRVISVAAGYPQLGLQGYSAHVGSCDHAAVAATLRADGLTYRAWGDARGEKAAIVVGVDDMDWVREGQWTPGPNVVPWVDPLTDAQRTGRLGEYTQERFALAFPAGGFAPADYREYYHSLQFSPAGLRAPRGARVVVALCVTRATVNGLGALSYLGGKVNGYLTVVNAQGHRREFLSE